ncbi:MAG: TIGR00266 family protein [bacterium]|nr:TIGR00266 family protein [bacterium]
MTHNVQIAGFSGSDEPARVTEAFAQLFRITPEKAAALLARIPVTIKEGLDADTAQKYRATLEEIGLRVEVIVQQANASAQLPDSGGLPAAAAAQSAAAAPAEKYRPMPPADLQDAGQPGFSFVIEGRPDYAFLTVQIPANKTLKVEASAMATMDTNLKMKTKLKGGFGRLLTGESLFLNDFTAENVAGEIGIAPAAPGDLAHVYLRGETIFLQNSAFVACDPAVNLETKWQGFTKGFFSGERFFLVRASGHGDLWFNTYGGMIMLDVDGDYVVDTGNIVAFTEGLDYSISKIGGYKSLFFSGEGLVCRFKGRGRVWIQTRTASAFVSWAHWFRPVKNSN